MITNDPISDLLTRIRNGKERAKETVEVPHTNILESIAKILKEEAFILDYKVEKHDVQGKITLTLKYVNGVSAISELKRVSTPGLRKYVGYREVPRIKNGLGITILSTSRGIMTDTTAKQEKVGGEILATIW